MSIIAGLVDRRGSEPPANRVEAMLACFSGYCPDGLRSVDEGVCVLGIGRLVTSAAPRRADGLYEVGKICAVVDGRLDRVEDLRASLGLLSDASDAEICVRAYERLGVECFARLRGDFAVVIWDGRFEILIAARDSFAVRPLCYASGAGWLAVASDPEQLLAAALVSGLPDDDMVIDYLLWDTRRVDRTFFREVSALSPGHYLVADSNGIRTSEFRSRALSQVHLSSRAEYWTEYRRRFSAAVESCIESKYPVVAELSGGLDSSSIVCASDRLLAERPGLCPSFVAAAGLYPGLTCDEEPFVRAVAAHVRLPVECWNGTDNSVNELDPSSVALPGGKSATFSGTDGQFRIAHALGARVLISGAGGDQIGTPSGGLRDAVTELRWPDAARMVFGRPRTNAVKIAGTLGALARSFAPPGVRRLKSAFDRLERRPSWLSPWARSYPRARPDPEPPSDWQSEIQRRTWRSVTSGPHALVMSYLQHYAIRRAVDIRFPFLDLEVVSLALSIPARFWPPAWRFERLHREILQEWLPPEIVRRRSKANFEPAVVLRVRRHLPSIRDLFSSSGWKSGRFVDEEEARRLLTTFERANPPDLKTTYGLWAISTLEAWLRAVSGYYPQTLGRG